MRLPTSTRSSEHIPGEQEQGCSHCQHGNEGSKHIGQTSSLGTTHPQGLELIESEVQGFRGVITIGTFGISMPHLSVREVDVDGRRWDCLANVVDRDLCELLQQIPWMVFSTTDHEVVVRAAVELVLSSTLHLN